MTEKTSDVGKDVSVRPPSSDAVGQFSLDGQYIGHLNERITELAFELAELRAENARLIAEANRRDEKWMAGINAACGVELCYDPIGGDRASAIRARMPTLDEYVAVLKKTAREFEAENARLARAAEAWDAVVKHRIDVTCLGGDEPAWMTEASENYKHTGDASDPIEAVLALAAKLEGR